MVSLERAASGCERVVHLVGIIQETSGTTFQRVHVDGTRNLLEAAKKAGVRHFFFQSALGTRPGAKSAYHKSKWESEELVRAGSIAYTILRPSLIYGPGDQFTIRLSDMIRLSPILPIIGSGKSKVQPLFINDEVACILKAVTSDAYLNELYELGGRAIPTRATVAIAGPESRPAVHMPLFIMKTVAKALEAVLTKPPLTTDQLIMIEEDNVCTLRDIRDAFGIEPIKFREGLRKFIAAK
jgi:NADH dehydrogenase